MDGRDDPGERPKARSSSVLWAETIAHFASRRTRDTRLTRARKITDKVQLRCVYRSRA